MKDQLTLAELQEDDRIDEMEHKLRLARLQRRQREVSVIVDTYALHAFINILGLFVMIVIGGVVFGISSTISR